MTNFHLKRDTWQEFTLTLSCSWTPLSKTAHSWPLSTRSGCDRVAWKRLSGSEKKVARQYTVYYIMISTCTNPGSGKSCKVGKELEPIRADPVGARGIGQAIVQSSSLRLVTGGNANKKMDNVNSPHIDVILNYEGDLGFKVLPFTSWRYNLLATFLLNGLSCWQSAHLLPGQPCRDRVLFNLWTVKPVYFMCTALLKCASQLRDTWAADLFYYFCAVLVKLAKLRPRCCSHRCNGGILPRCCGAPVRRAKDLCNC